MSGEPQQTKGDKMAHTAHVQDYYLNQGCCDSAKEEQEFLKISKEYADKHKVSIGVAATLFMLVGEGFFNLFSGLTESESFEMINFIFEKNGIDCAI
jgi:hypothetical protein